GTAGGRVVGVRRRRVRGGDAATGAGGAAVKALAIAGVSLRRPFRDRTNIFFVIVSPLLFLFVLGLLFGGGQAPQLGVVGTGEGPLAQRLIAALSADDRIEVVRFDDVDALRTNVERGLVNGGLVIPEDYDARLRDGTQVTLEWLAREGEGNAASLAVWVRSVVSSEAALLRTAQFGQAEGVGDLDQNLQAVEQIDRAGGGATVAVPPVPVAGVVAAAAVRVPHLADSGRGGDRSPPARGGQPDARHPHPGRHRSHRRSARPVRDRSGARADRDRRLSGAVRRGLGRPVGGGRGAAVVLRRGQRCRHVDRRAVPHRGTGAGGVTGPGAGTGRDRRGDGAAGGAQRNRADGRPVHPARLGLR